MRRSFARGSVLLGACVVAFTLVGGAQAAGDRDRDVAGAAQGRKVAAKGKVAAIGKRVIVVKRGSGRGVKCRYRARTFPSWVTKGARVTAFCEGRGRGRKLVDIRGRGAWKARQSLAETEVKGTIAALAAPSKGSEGRIEITAGGSALTCTVDRAGPTLAGFKVGDTVEAKCLLLADVWTLTRIEHEDDIGPGGGSFLDDEIEMHGFIDTLTAPGTDAAGTIALVAGNSSISCTIPAGSPLASGFATGDLVEVKCELVGGAWTLTRITHEDDLPGTGGGPIGDDETEVTGTIDSLTAPGAANGSISVGGATCAIPAGSSLVASFDVGDLVEIKCERFAGDWVLTRIRTEDES